MTKSTDQSGNQPVGNTPQVNYSGDGRGGTIHYTNAKIRFDLWYELAMSPAIVIIGIPEPEYWEAQTKTPLSRRISILEFIGQQIIDDKLAGEGHIGIEQDNIMTIYRGKKPHTISG